MADNSQNEPEIMNRQRLIMLCSNTLAELEKKISGRYRPNDNENLYLQTVRAITALIDTSNRVIRDAELEEMEQRLTTLETEAQQKQKVLE